MVVMSHSETFRRTQSAGAVSIVVTNSVDAGAANSDTITTTSGCNSEEFTEVSGGPVCPQTNSAKNPSSTADTVGRDVLKERELPSNDSKVALWRSVSETASEAKASHPAHSKESASFPSLPDVVLKQLGLMVRNERENYSENDVENRFIALSLAFKTDLLTLSSRLELQKRHRDQAELNMVAEVKLLKAALYKLSRNYIDSDSIEALTQIQAQVDVLQQATDKVSGSAELFGAVQQEHRLSRATEVLVSHVENVKRSMEKIGAELEEVKRVLAENNIVMEDADLPDEPVPRVRYRSLAAITAKKMNSKRRASIAAMPRPISSPTDTRSLGGPLSPDGRPRNQMANLVSAMRGRSTLMLIPGDSQDLGVDVTEGDLSEKAQETMSTLEEVPEAQREKSVPLEEIIEIASEVNNNLDGDNEILHHEIEDEVKVLPRVSITDQDDMTSSKKVEIFHQDRGNPIKLIRYGLLDKMYSAKTVATVYFRQNKTVIVSKIRFYMASLLCAAAAWFIIWIFVPQSS